MVIAYFLTNYWKKSVQICRQKKFFMKTGSFIFVGITLLIFI